MEIKFIEFPGYHEMRICAFYLTPNPSVIHRRINTTSTYTKKFIDENFRYRLQPTCRCCSCCHEWEFVCPIPIPPNVSKNKPLHTLTNSVACTHKHTWAYLCNVYTNKPAICTSTQTLFAATIEKIVQNERRPFSCFILANCCSNVEKYLSVGKLWTKRLNLPTNLSYFALPTNAYIRMYIANILVL